MCDVNATLPDVGEYEDLCRHMQNCTLQNESGAYLHMGNSLLYLYGEFGFRVISQNSLRTIVHIFHAGSGRLSK